MTVKLTQATPFTPLQNAALRLALGTIQMLLASGADVNARKVFVQTALMLVGEVWQEAKRSLRKSTNHRGRRLLTRSSRRAPIKGWAILRG